MSQVTVTLPDGTTMQVEMADEVVAHAADPAGAYLGLVALGPGALQVTSAPPSAGTWRWQGGEWQRVFSIADLKATKVQELAEAWSAEFHGGMDVGAYRVPTDQAALVDYLLLRQILADGDWSDTPVRLADGSFHLLTQVQAQALWAALKTHRRTLLGKLSAKAALVLDAGTDTAEELALITWASVP